MPYYSFELAGGTPRHLISAYFIGKNHVLKSSIFVDPYHEKLHYGGQLALYGCSRNRDNLSFDADLRLWNSEKFSCHGPDGLIHTSGHYGGFISGTMYYRLPVNREKGYRFYISAGFALKQPDTPEDTPWPEVSE